jgi:pimeloyl-ACP methyl ester carboxylesterase
MKRCAFAAMFCTAMAFTSAAARAGEPQLSYVNFPSTALSTFFNQPVQIAATILLPDSYYTEPQRRYPVVYVISAFDDFYAIDVSRQLEWQRPMRALGSQFMIVFLRGMIEFHGEAIHDQYADSANDGPWGTALTSEFIPATDARFRTLGAGGRFLFGHSSGGWSALWLQVNYPDAFNGAWVVSPDAVDFHDFYGPDLTKPSANFYRDASGKAYGECRERGHDTLTMGQFATGLGECGGSAEMRTVEKVSAVRQFDTYDVVYSPRRTDGSPAQLFNRANGAIDPAVAAYWEEHYDITRILQERWSTLGPQLQGKLHVFVGAQDTFHTNDSVVLMRDALHNLGSDAEIQIVPGDDHWQILDWHGGMIGYALAEMLQRLTPK